ncbi:peptidoglycan-binding protein [Bradyrhizobium macuxiense]|uniref:Peptidoglycan-binding protein n=1 Tax=Bradyrhizobium macuxiense TaxID=1755647 RepID=A0A109JYR5_9BRAD|nr:serine protease [Bradyrhizobium macuxiense]KWV57523.1 peptidoglycan-binding protein [Bradyrhizobium macuxiense]
MRSVLSATLMVAAVMVAGVGAAHAQMTPPSTLGAKPKSVTTVPIRPPLQKPEDTANAMAQAERLALQSDLAWVGQYNGAITGDVSERMVNAIKEFQKGRGGKPTGVLNPQERGVLADTARRRQENVGWKIVTEPATGARLGIPSKLVPQLTSDASGAKWTSATGTIQVLLTRRKEANPTTASLADREKKEPAGRTIDYTVVKPDFFVLSGMQGLKKFYLRGTFRGDEVRILTILYDQATENTVEPVVIAMSSAFNAFPAGAQIGPPPRKTVEYGTGIVVSDDGAVITDRVATDDCIALTIPGYGNADRVAEDKEHDLALLRIYGARGLKPLDIAGNATTTALDITGIADPQNQGGGAAVSSVKASVAQLGGGGDAALSPAPAIGFSGAAALDSDGRFAGIALLKPVIVAGPANATPPAQAALVPASTVRDFLKAHDVTASGGSADAKAAVVRVICVRK